MYIYRIYKLNMVYSLHLQAAQVGKGRGSRVERGVTQLAANLHRDKRQSNSNAAPGPAAAVVSAVAAVSGVARVAAAAAALLLLTAVAFGILGPIV